MKNLINNLKQLWDEKPFALILVLAVFFRILAVFFSKGFGMHDDHFLVIEVPQMWADGVRPPGWFPGKDEWTTPSGHSLFYVGLQYVLLSIFNWLGISSPQSKMFFVRLLLAAWSLLTILYGYKIALKLRDRNAARLTGLLLAVFWFMPFLSVRNLVEVICIPPMIYAIWLIIKSDNKRRQLVFWAGFLLGVAFSIRFQTLIFAGGVGLALLFQKKWIDAIFLGLGLLISILLLQGIIDYYLWGYPLGELQEYIRLNITDAYRYNAIAWYSYLLLILGILIPPVSFFLFYGFIRSWKKHLIVFLPAALFLVFHSIFPNKQERFVLPIIPFIISLGVVGWYEFYNGSGFWKKRKSLYRACWIFFWALNIFLLPVISTMYSKKARVESMTYLSKYENVGYILRENMNAYNTKIIPMFYLGQWVAEREITKSIPIEWHINNGTLKGENAPSFVIFYEEKNIDQRIENVKTEIPNLVFEAKIEPGFVDKFIHWLNPINANEVIYIYRNRDKIPAKLP